MRALYPLTAASTGRAGSAYGSASNPVTTTAPTGFGAGAASGRPIPPGLTGGLGMPAYPASIGGPAASTAPSMNSPGLASRPSYASSNYPASPTPAGFAPRTGLPASAPGAATAASPDPRMSPTAPAANGAGGGPAQGYWGPTGPPRKPTFWERVGKFFDRRDQEDSDPNPTLFRDPSTGNRFLPAGTKPWLRQMN